LSFHSILLCTDVIIAPLKKRVIKADRRYTTKRIANNKIFHRVPENVSVIFFSIPSIRIVS
jgi:hypothetical protein